MTSLTDVRLLIRTSLTAWPNATTDLIVDDVVRRTPREDLEDAYRATLATHVVTMEREHRPRAPVPPAPPVPLRERPSRFQQGLALLRDRDVPDAAERASISNSLAGMKRLVEEESAKLAFADLALAECLDERFWPRGEEKRGRDLTVGDHKWLSARQLPSIVGQIQRAAWHRAVAREMLRANAPTTADLARMRRDAA